MRIPTEFNGFVTLGDDTLPFSFSMNNYILRVYPDHDTWYQKYTDPDFYLPLLKHDPQEHKDPEFTLLRGFTPEGKSVIFHASKRPGYRGGFLSFGVSWFFLARFSGDTEEKFTNLRVTGLAINSFFSPDRVYENTINEDKDSHKIDKMSVIAQSSKPADCGSFRYEDIDVSMVVQSFATLHFRNEKPITAESIFNLSCSQPIDIGKAADLAFLTVQVFRMLSYRLNINLNNIELRRKNEDGLFDVYGVICLHLKKYLNENESDRKYSITYDDIGNHLAGIFKGIYKEEIAASAIPETFQGRSYYPSSRIYMILADYDRMFDEELKSLITKSETFSESKKEVIELIKSVSENLDEAKIQDYKRIWQSVQSVGNGVSYLKKTQLGFKNVKSVMEPFIKRYYKGNYSEATNALSRRLSTLRNKIAHGTLNIEIKQEHLVDIKMLEYFIYALILKYAGVDDEKKVKHAIGMLFHDSVA